MTRAKESKDTIWLVDDSEIIHKAIKLVLKGYDIRSFYSGKEFLDFIELQDFQLPDLILLDILMEPISGFEVLESLKEIIEFREIPIIILSTKEAIDDKVKGLEMGATDYIVKPFYERELYARIRVHIKIKKNHDALREKVIMDFLTNTYNKRHLYTKLHTQFSMYNRHQSSFSLIFFDIDHFKIINDTYGHLTGDYILKELCSEIKNIIRNEDDLFRYGGEEFVLLAPFSSRENAHTIAEKIRTRIMEKTFMSNDEALRITLSLGIASLPEDKVETREQLLELADKRMLKAKKSGRNRVVDSD